MPEKVIYPINIVAKDEQNNTIYDIGEYVTFSGKLTMTMNIRGADIGEISINATKAIHAMTEALVKRDKENKTTTEDLLAEEVSLFNAKKEMEDGR